MADEVDEIDEQPIPKAKGGGSSILKMLMIVVLAVASSAGGGVISFVLMNKYGGGPHAAAAETGDHKEETPEELAKAAEEEMAEMLEKGAVLPLEPFVVNLADPEAPRYLRIKISLMVDDKTKAKEASENEALTLKVRDVILQSLTVKTSKDLINEEGKNKLRREIHDKISVYFRDPKLVDVLFTEFVIQL